MVESFLLCNFAGMCFPDLRSWSDRTLCCIKWKLSYPAHLHRLCFFISYGVLDLAYIDHSLFFIMGHFALDLTRMNQVRGELLVHWTHPFWL